MMTTASTSRSSCARSRQPSKPPPAEAKKPAEAKQPSTDAKKPPLPAESRAKHPDEIAISAYWTADKARGGTGPVPRIEQTESITDELDELRTKRRWPLVLIAIVLVGGAAALIYQYVVKGKVAAATAPRPLAPVSVELPREPAKPAPPPPVDPAEAVTVATQTLRSSLAATSQRIQRLAAAALARTGDPAARDVLAAQLGLPTAAGSSSIPPETSDIARLDLAYSLARGGDLRGRDVLTAALGSPRSEARDEAARLLALLGDPHAAPHLTDLLGISQRRLGAAEHLAHLTHPAEPHAIKVLRQILDDDRASADDKARATIALGIAGYADVAPALRDMLGDPHVNAFAAAALAELKDTAARPVLEHQLDSPMLRVRAARSLRRLDPKLDPRPLLPPLVGLVRAGRDTDQIQAAEAILVLAGPPALADYE